MAETTSNFMRKAKSDISVTIGITAVILFFAISGLVAYTNTRNLSDGAIEVSRTHETILLMNEIQGLARDAETGQRGYVITGDDSYLAPYYTARSQVNSHLTQLETLFKDNPEYAARIPAIKQHLQNKMSELAETIRIRKEEGFAAAHKVVVSDAGKMEMDALHAQLEAIEAKEQEVREQRKKDREIFRQKAITSSILSAIIGVVLAIMVAHLINRSTQQRRRQDWLQSGQVGLGSSMLGEQRAEELGRNVLSFLVDYFDAQVGAFFIRVGDEYQRVASYGVLEDGSTLERFKKGEGLLGQSVEDKRAFVVNDVPEGYIAVSSGLGQSSPRNLVIAPAISEDGVNAVVELGFIHPIPELSLELLNRISNGIGLALRAANYRTHLQNLLEETQRQSEELQTQSEELRVSNEELEEQSRALKESQARLEQQQVEMEQTNAQLEEQTQMLERQRDDLAHSQSAVQQKANELELASQYKSDFLANMSHELRTPLNSSLILAKLLADNSAGNLSQEQVRYAQTIQSSGNDLLALINDILDLSKIEAGHMEISPESISISRLLKDITRVFEPMAQQKGLKFETKVAPGCSKTITSDRQRLEQILKNLLSNALKFTEQGKVELAVNIADDGNVSFAVTDTGIGISKQQQAAIFDAFRQADSTISRKYGGTGLGLSISRELARLLGGSIQLQSTEGKGSTFSLVVPKEYDASTIQPAAHAIAAPAPLEELPVKKNGSKEPAKLKRRALDDDRETLSGDDRVILVVEDDESFAKILYQLVRELDFKCLLADTAEEALIIAKQYIPSAVVLDVGLPDHSGLTVLDRLKRDTRTRHIPVHVVSASDQSQTAFALGAIGYMLKPVKREELSDALKKMETKLLQRMRRVLVVEDDEVQRDSLGKLLGSHDVKIVGVGTAAECLELLKKETFDCMVLDLSLPDATGYSLLETLSKEDDYAFPPVIVYTGRDLSNEDEQRLRRYSKSIIIKGAKSPERLLDEVTLFLHQVVSDLPAEQQKMLEKAQNRDAMLEGRRVLVVEDDVRNVYALTNILEPHGVHVQIARNGLEALEALKKNKKEPVDLVLMDVMMPEMDGLTATREIRKNAEWKKLPIIMLTAKAMPGDQERCLDAGANDYMAKPLDVEKLLSLVRVWMPR